jgi:hypothetical protein
MTDHLILGGAYTGSDDGCRLTWDALYPYQKQAPIIIEFLENDSTLYVKNDKTATSVGTAELSDTGEFTLAEYDDGTYYLAITSGDTAGEVRRIISNTANALTLESDFDVPLSGTPTYQIVKDNVHTLWNKYLPYTIAGFMQLETVKTTEDWQKILDQHNDLAGAASYHRSFFQDLSTLEEYLKKGKAIYEGIAAGIVT